MYILPQKVLSICFDQLSGCIRPEWESEPNLSKKDRVIINEGTHIKSEKPICIHCHAYYLDVMAELIHAWRNIPNRVMLINTDSSFKAKVIEEMLIARGEANFVIKVTQNRGRDIAPFLIAFKDEILKCSTVIHCHTKKTPHASSGYGDHWRSSLVNSTFPEKVLATNFADLLQQDSKGLIMPWPHKFIAHNVNWGRNFRQTKGIMKQLGYKISRDTFLYFPAGSFFWANVKSLTPLFEIGLRFQDFSLEPMPADGRLAHAIERCIGLLPFFQENRSYAHYSKAKMNGHQKNSSQSFLVEMPSQSEVIGHCGKWFLDGFNKAIKMDSNRIISVKLNRS